METRAPWSPEGYAFGPDEGFPLPHNAWIDGRYFASMGIPLLDGRAFDARDDGDAPLVAIVDEDFVEKFWPGQNPIGKRLHRGASDTNPWQTVVGLVGTVKVEDLAEQDDRGAVYFAMTQTEAGRQASRITNLTLVHPRRWCGGVAGRHGAHHDPRPRSPSFRSTTSA